MGRFINYIVRKVKHRYPETYRNKALGVFLMALGIFDLLAFESLLGLLAIGVAIFTCYLKEDLFTTD